MKLRTLSMTVLALTMTLPRLSQAADGIHEGMWELTSEMVIPGVPMKIPPTVIKHCYDKQEAQDSTKIISRNKDCTVTDLKTSGNRVRWKMKCGGKNPGSFSGETLFAGDSYTSSMKMHGEGKEKLDMTIKIKGKRLGACP